MPAFMTLALMLALLLAAAKIAGHASVRVRTPAILGELLVGVLFGPSLLNVLGHISAHREAVTSALGMLAEIGALLLTRELEGGGDVLLTYFWGTIFRDSVGFLCVACLRWDGHKWVWSYYWLGHFWRAGEFAAVLAG